MHPGLLAVSQVQRKSSMRILFVLRSFVVASYLIFGLIPFNHTKRHIHCYDFVIMFMIPFIYIFCYLMANFETFSVQKLTKCNSICTLGNALFIHLGIFVYLIDFLLGVLRGKNFYPQFYERLQAIDNVLTKCQKDVRIKPKTVNLFKAFVVSILISAFLYAIYYDVVFLRSYFENMFFIASVAVTFPFVASSIVQAQFIYVVLMISERFNKLNFLLDTLNRECAKKNIPVQVFDIETAVSGKKLLPELFSAAKTKLEQMTSESDVSSNSEDDMGMNVLADIECKTSEECLADLFQLHEKILNLSGMANSEFGPQVVPYMVVCFVTSIFGIFLETKVIFIAGGRNDLLDYVAHIYVIWSLITMVVAYLVLRMCCNANGHSRQSAMIVHEIMQKKPPFMVGNDTYYNKMKAFTLQFLHWEGYFQFNGIGMFALDYTFIFSTVSAATSYLIVLLQFDMSEILKNEGLST